MIRLNILQTNMNMSTLATIGHGRLDVKSVTCVFYIYYMPMTVNIVHLVIVSFIFIPQP